VTSATPEPPSYGADPFGTARLRESTLRAWRDSPTRLTEDTNVERDLRVGAYRDRLFVELAQNAADAAMAARAPGRLRVSLVDRELRFANTGAPLDARGVASLASLRASGKTGGTVGRFGVGFAAVRTVSDAPTVVSTTGGVAFSADRTRQAAGIDGDVPVLRLPWPVPADVPAGFGHGFCVLSDSADVAYKVTAEYDPALELGFAWNDPEIGVDWPIHEPTLSERDQKLPPWEEVKSSFIYKPR
jgi:hypothetical protein